jgi:hypothetical protein
MSSIGSIGSKGYPEEKQQQFEPLELDFIFDSLMRSAADWKDWGLLEQYTVWKLLKKIDVMREGKFSPAFRNGDHPKVVTATTREAKW